MLFEAAQTAESRACRAVPTGRARAQRAVGLVAAVMLLLAAGPIERAAAADRIVAEVSAETSNGYGRIVYRFNGDLDANVRLSNGILVIGFSVPVSVSIERMNAIAAGYVSAARRDPDGKGIRMALAQKVTLHSLQVNDRLFVDLLPDGWKGPPPPLPQEVVEELARRARDAERRERQMLQLTKKKQMVVTRVRVAHQPNFSRYVFEVPDPVEVISERSGDTLNLRLDAPLKFDLGEAKASLPPMIEHLDAETADQTTNIKFSFVGKVDVRTFREDNTYVVDVAAVAAPFKRSDAVPAAPGVPKVPPGFDVPQTVPARTQDRAQDRVEDGETAGDRAGNRQGGKSDETPADRAPEPVRAPPAAERAPAAPLAKSMPDPVTRIAAASQPAPDARAPGPNASPSSRGVPETPSETPGDKSAANQTADRSDAAAPPNVAPPSTAVPAPSTVPAPDHGAAAASNPPVLVQVQRQGDNLKLVFPFAAKTSGAIFRRADTLWAVFDTATPVDVAVLRNEPTRTIASATAITRPDVQIVRMKLNRPRLTSFTGVDDDWTIAIGDTVLDPTLPVVVTRNPVGSARASAVAPFEDPRSMHRITDPEAGDTLFVVTAFAPARGVLKERDFVEFRVLESTHGIVVQPFADDVAVDLAGDKVIISRPSGLTMSAANQIGRRTGYRPVVFDQQSWGFDRQANFYDRQRSLIAAAAAAPDNKRLPPRFDLARFYLAQGMYPEAKGVLDVALSEDHPTVEDSTGLVMRAIAKIMMSRPEEALQDLANPLVGNNHDAQLWRALAFAKQGKWPEAAENFKKVEAAIATLPVEMQRQLFIAATRAAIETRDFGAAADRLNEFETLGVPKEIEPRIAVLSGRLAEGMGRNDEALVAYRAAADSTDRVAAARGRLHEIELQFQLGELKPPEVIDALEALTTFWRGDETEVEALQILAHLYTDAERYRDAFHVMRTALKAHPNSGLTRSIQDEAATTFDALFLAGKGDAMPVIEALGLFYDFRELTPIGRRGDEMIRHLADRLVSVDLLDQATELLQYQVDHRLQGAARAQVATRLAVVYLMNRKPDKALAALRSTRTADVSNELHDQRLLVESRALSDIGRHDVAIDVLSSLNSREAARMRADAYWAAKRWREASEQIELMYGDRFKGFEPLNELERADLLRAAIGYAIGDDQIGLGRFRDKYAAKMAGSSDSHAFEVATSPLAANGPDFREVVRQIAAVDTLDGFLRMLRARYPETGSFASVPPADRPAAPPVSPAGAPRADAAPTGSIARPVFPESRLAGAWRLRGGMR